MTEPLRRVPPPRENEGMSPYQSIKVVGFLMVFFGPVLPLTIFLWRLAVGG